MDPVQLLLALATLVKNPALGGGGLSKDQTYAAILHLVELIKGGRATAQALREWGDEIKAMADAGIQPSQRDFDRWTGRLDTALAVIEEAKQRLEQESDVPNPPAAINNALEEADKPDPAESPALAALDAAAVSAEKPVESQQNLALTDAAPQPDPEPEPEAPKSKGRKSR